MPQLDTATFLPQLFWLAITFLALYLIMAKVALPRVAEVLDQRSGRIAKDLEETEKMKHQADEAKAAYEAALAEARAQAQSLLLANRKALQAEVEESLAKVMTKLAKDGAKAEAAIAAAKAEAMTSIRGVTTDVCKGVVARLTGVELDEAMVQKTVEAKLASLQPAQGAAS
jgi:F-type H+-transporting ATPase subunit b